MKEGPRFLCGGSWHIYRQKAEFLAVPQKYSAGDQDNHTREKKHPPGAVFYVIALSAEKLLSAGNTVRRLVVPGHHPAVRALDHSNVREPTMLSKQRA